jgi:hypothetical protein
MAKATIERMKDEFSKQTYREKRRQKTPHHFPLVVTAQTITASECAEQAARESKVPIIR